MGSSGLIGAHQGSSSSIHVWDRSARRAAAGRASRSCGRSGTARGRLSMTSQKGMCEEQARNGRGRVGGQSSDGGCGGGARTSMWLHPARLSMNTPHCGHCPASRALHHRRMPCAWTSSHIVPGCHAALQSKQTESPHVGHSHLHVRQGHTSARNHVDSPYVRRTAARMHGTRVHGRTSAQAHGRTGARRACCAITCGEVRGGCGRANKRRRNRASLR